MMTELPATPRQSYGIFAPTKSTPELMELSARLGSLMPYRKAADVIAEFLPVKSSESFVTVRGEFRRAQHKAPRRLHEATTGNIARPVDDDQRTHAVGHIRVHAVAADPL